MRRVLIARATGCLGWRMVAKFKANGWYVGALVRTPKTAAMVFSDADEIIGAEATRRETLIGVMGDVDLVVSALGIMVFEANDYSGFWLGHSEGGKEIDAIVLFSPRRQLVVCVAGIGSGFRAQLTASSLIESLDRCGAGAC